MRAKPTAESTQWQRAQSSGRKRSSDTPIAFYRPTSGLIMTNISTYSAKPYEPAMDGNTSSSGVRLLRFTDLSSKEH